MSTSKSNAGFVEQFIFGGLYMEVDFKNDSSMTQPDNFYMVISTTTSESANLRDVTRQKEVIQGYPAVLIQGERKFPNTDLPDTYFPFQTLYINLHTGVLEVYPQLDINFHDGDYSYYEGALAKVLNRFTTTLKITSNPAPFPSPAPDSPANLNFVTYSSPYNKWQAEIPVTGKSHLENSALNASKIVREDWLLGSDIDLNIALQDKISFDRSKPLIEQLDNQTKILTEAYALKDPKIELITINNQPALLLTGKSPENTRASDSDLAYHSYGCILLPDAAANTLYTIRVWVTQPEGEPNYQPILDKLLATFQVTS